MIDDGHFWTVTILLALATYAIRLSFLAWGKDRVWSPRVRRMLDLVPVTVLPALIVPLIVFPDATGGAFDPIRLAAAAVALAVGVATRNVMAVIVAGMTAIVVFQALMPG